MLNKTRKLYTFYIMPYLLSILLFLLNVLVSGQSLQAQGSSSPQALVQASPASESSDFRFNTAQEVFSFYLNSLRSFYSGNSAAIDDSLNAIDLSKLALASRKSQGQVLAKKLYAILDYKNKGNLYTYRQIKKVNDQEATLVVAKEFTLRFTSKNNSWLIDSNSLDDVNTYFDFLQSQGSFKNKKELIAELPWYTKIRTKIPTQLRPSFLYLEYWQWLAIALFVLVFTLLKQVIFYILNRFASVFTKNIIGADSALEETELINNLVKPSTYFVLAIILGAVIPFFDFSLRITSYIFQLLLFIKIILGGILVYNLLDLFSVTSLKFSKESANKTQEVLLSLFRKLAKFISVVAVFIILLSSFGINITGLLAGLGIGSIAFALAAQNTVENLFGSITVLLDRPFQEGDFVKFNNIEGTVEHIGLRCTRLRTPMNSLVSVPNSQLISNIVDNLGARKYRLLRMTLDFTYATSQEQLNSFCRELRALIEAHPDSRKDNYQVRFSEFGAYSLKVFVNVYFASIDYTQELRLKEEFLYKIWDIAEQLKMEFAYPTQTLIMDKKDYG